MSTLASPPRAARLDGSERVAEDRRRVPPNSLTTVTESILNRVANGDQAALGECITRYGGLVWSLARRLLRDDREAEDGVQDVFVELWQSAGRFDPGRASESTFVGMVARRRLIDRRRRMDRVPDPLPLDTRQPATEEADPLEQDDRNAQLARAWKELREEERTVLELAIHGGQTYAEIAERTGTPLGTVKSRARSGLQRLRENLSRVGVEAGGPTS